MSRRADHFQRMSVEPLPSRKVTAMALRAKSREQIEKAGEAYMAVIKSHNEGLISLHDSCDDFTLLARAFCSRFPNNTADDAKKSVDMVRRVISDIRAVFRRYSLRIVSSNG
ncbi:hypothetical protein M427DRAFT_134877 [Gonapodya prolifera JEL478]|uniref:Uncharacterized protein n=1 Tax=Gonapodya prolifera (strain JEL478) TaxID=1344416 RepID=A0A139AH35_GONPJ|nr:hypothetical protein M427DRAFT_134877 [Gonapodya prolifera JEL478]|eukprot:KXS15874.1 hypothetical protein M427DRAFT_134877 [Gonapodya prolifera JEL478]